MGRDKEKPLGETVGKNHEKGFGLEEWIMDGWFTEAGMVSKGFERNAEKGLVVTINTKVKF